MGWGRERGCWRTPAESWASGRRQEEGHEVLFCREPHTMVAHCGRQLIADARLFFCAGHIWHTWKSKASQGHGGTVVRTFLPSFLSSSFGKEHQEKGSDQENSGHGHWENTVISVPFLSHLLQLSFATLLNPLEATLATNYSAKIFLFFLSFEQWWHVQVEIHQTLLSVNEI